MDLLIFQEFEVLIFVSTSDKVSDVVFSALLPLGTLSSDAYYAFYCIWHVFVSKLALFS